MTKTAQSLSDLSLSSLAQRQVIEIAKTWLGTPYHHQGAVKYAGADCLGFIRGLYLEVTGEATKKPPAYSRDWADYSKEDPMLAAARSYLHEINIHDRQPGDILIFRFRPQMAAKHAAVFINPETMIHAVEYLGVCEAVLTRWWQRHIAGVFRFDQKYFS